MDMSPSLPTYIVLSFNNLLTYRKSHPFPSDFCLFFFFFIFFPSSSHGGHATHSDWVLDTWQRLHQIEDTWPRCRRHLTGTRHTLTAQLGPLNGLLSKHGECTGEGHVVLWETGGLPFNVVYSFQLLTGANPGTTLANLEFYINDHCNI